MVSTELYQEVLTRLRNAIDGENYFSGTLAFSFGGEESIGNTAGAIDCRLTASVIVCREPKMPSDTNQNAVSDLIPVWWEFHTSDAGGEQNNDFSFSEMMRLL